MARTLPWATQASTSRSRPPPSTGKFTSQDDHTISTPKRPRVSSPGLPETHNPNYEPAQDSHRQDLRAPSSSPPNNAADLAPPPAYELMRSSDLYDNDDAWIMVEDELEATAKLFTRHLHYSEYKRLKQHSALNRSSNLLRPVARTAAENATGTSVAENAEALRALQRRRSRLETSVANALRPGDDESSDESDEMPDTNLALLMHSPHKQRGARTDLTAVLDRSPGTTKRLPEHSRGGREEVEAEAEILDDDDNDDDDLDMPAVRPLGSLTKASAPTISTLLPEARTFTELPDLKPSRSTPAPDKASRGRSKEIGTHMHELSGKTGQRRARQMQIKDEKDDEIPTFLV